ncbi:MAG: urease accessory protein UreD [Flavisolibacter sp.]
MAMIATVQIHTTLNDKAITILKKSFATPPFKIITIKEEEDQKFANVILMSSSPGILDQDEYELDINLGRKTTLKLETQSFQRLFQMEKGATQRLKVCMEKSSSFFYVPHPTVPHQQSRYCSSTQVYMSEDCNLVLSEILTCGRKLCGEFFQFSRFQNITEIFLNERLIIKENMLLIPASGNILGLGQMEGYSHQGSLISMVKSSQVAGFIEGIQDILEKQPDRIFGLSQLPFDGIIDRLLGNSAEQLFACNKNISSFIFSKTNTPGIKTGIS